MEINHISEMCYLERWIMDKFRNLSIPEKKIAVFWDVIPCIPVKI
jgi:hypothetical protein